MKKTNSWEIVLLVLVCVATATNAIEETGTAEKMVLRSLDPPIFLPDGREFKTWEQPLKFTRTYYVNQNHTKASDDNPGTKDRPFKTINQAAQILQPGERVVVASGIYREWVRPARGGTGPDKMISYEAAPGAKVVIKGSEVVPDDLWQRSFLWRADDWKKPIDTPLDIKPWMVALPTELFEGYNPFALVNQSRFSDPTQPAYVLRRGLVFQDGRRLKQVRRYVELFKEDGTYWVENHGLVLHIRPFGDTDPRQHIFEITVHEQIFAPKTYFLDYIRVKGFIMEHAGDGFPIPQRAALSASRGHHWIIEDNTIRWANAIGMDIGMQSWLSEKPEICGYQIVRRNTVTDCGIGGIAGYGHDLEDTLVENNVLLRNCWQHCEPMCENAAIKLHHTNGGLIRRNIIKDTSQGSGIWLDYGIKNTRCSQNVIVNTLSFRGGIFVEASQEINMVDNNIIWNSRVNDNLDNAVMGWGGSGVYTHDTDRLIIAHNFIAQTQRAGIFLDLGNTQRWVYGRGATSRKHNVLSNILIDCGRAIEFDNGDNNSDYNLFSNISEPGSWRIHRPVQNLDLEAWQQFYRWDIHGKLAEIKAELDSKTLELIWSVKGEVPECPRLEVIREDFFNRPLTNRNIAAGPFGTIPSDTEKIIIDPRPVQSNYQ